MKKSLFIIGLLIAGFRLLPAQNQFGGGPAPTFLHKGHCLTPAQRASEWNHTQHKRRELIDEGKLTDRSNPARSVQTTSFAWPIRQSPTSTYRGYYGITNYVDHDATAGLRDYNCNAVTYDGHKGTDYATWPFPWEMMDNNDVEVVAAAKGVILEKRDGNFDQSCDWKNKPWNAVYVEHPDGTIAWYGHLKKNSLTTKAVGDSVFPGDFLGYIGSSGISTGPHLHFELFDNLGNTLDPYMGTCNNTTAISRWDNQNPYQSPYLIHLQTGNQAPDYGNFCYGQEVSNAADQFQPGDRIYYSMYLQDYLTNLVTTFRIFDPNGALHASWNHSPTNFFPLSYWWWSRDIPSNAVQGEWRLEIEFNGEAVSHIYRVGNATRLDQLPDETIAVGPNPVENTLMIRRNKEMELNYTLINLQGQVLMSGRLNNEMLDISGLPKGIYVLQLAEVSKGGYIHKRITKR